MRYFLRARVDTGERSRGRASHRTSDLIKSCPLREGASEFDVMRLARAVYPLRARPVSEFFVQARDGRRAVGRVMTLRVESVEDGVPRFVGEARIIRAELRRRAVAAAAARGAARLAAAAFLGGVVYVARAREANFWAERAYRARE